MAGRGPAPKRSEDRARRNADPVEDKYVVASPAGQPELPEFTVQVELDGEVVEQTFFWPQVTRDWWAMWADSPLSADFTATDWDFLLDTARIHAAYWQGDLKLAGELRLRVAKFGATPEDRARLRIEFVRPEDDPVDVEESSGSRSRSKRRLRVAGE